MRFWIIFAIVLLNPLWFCILFYILPLGSIGPVVILTWPLNSIAIPALLFIASDRIKAKEPRITSKILAIPLGLFIAVLQLNSYFPLTYFFGLDDFDWM